MSFTSFNIRYLDSSSVHRLIFAQVLFHDMWTFVLLFCGPNFFVLPPLQTPSPPFWCVMVCWVVSGCLKALLPVCPGVEPTTALLTGSTSTSKEAALTCCPRPLMAPGPSTSVQCVMGEEGAVRSETLSQL